MRRPPHQRGPTTDALDRLTAALTDRYRIERELGAGGMATVYQAQDRTARSLAAQDANDMLYQFQASREYNPAPFLEKITAPLYAINSADDQVNPPELGLMERESGAKAQRRGGKAQRRKGATVIT